MVFRLIVHPYASNEKNTNVRFRIANTLSHAKDMQLLYFDKIHVINSSKVMVNIPAPNLLLYGLVPFYYIIP